jgi:two-component system cell cycle sensor histidine kinase/response regulator CckA
MPSSASDRSAETAAERHAALGGFARKLAHDLNNFATVIRTYSELLLADLPADSPTHADVSEVHRAANSMVRYVQRISRFARAGGIRLLPLNFGALLDDAINASDANDVIPIHVEMTEDARRATVETDGAWCADVFRELLQNAREASPVGEPVALTAEVRTLTAEEMHGSQLVGAGRWAVAAVVDRGSGFADSVNASAEEPFVTTKEGVRGAGFGLTLAAALARAQRGALTRERVAATTIVSLWFPLESAPREIA